MLCFNKICWNSTISCKNSSFKRLLSQLQNKNNYFMWKDISYNDSSHPHSLQSLDVFVPTNPFPRNLLPVCIFFHGGSWQRGDKNRFTNMNVGKTLAALGYVGVSVNYRLSPEVMVPDILNDVEFALHWIQQNVEKYGGNSSKLILIGHSAGAHLIMQLLANSDNLLNVESTSNLAGSLAGIIGISGVYNVVRLANASFYGSFAVEPAFGGSVQRWRELSPVCSLDKDKSHLANIPILLLNAESDFHFEVDTDEFLQGLKQLGNEKVQKQVIQDRNHWSIISQINETSLEDQTTVAILNFIKSVAR